MKRDRIAEQNCSIAKAAAVLADPWTILIIRELFAGSHRFADIADSTGMPPSVGSDRLKRLVEAGILERFEYSEHPPRSGYRLTRKGLDLLPVLATLIKWGDAHLHDDAGPTTVYRHTECGHEADPTVVCGHCGEVIGDGELSPEPA